MENINESIKLIENRKVPDYSSLRDLFLKEFKAVRNNNELIKNLVADLSNFLTGEILLFKINVKTFTLNGKQYIFVNDRFINYKTKLVFDVIYNEYYNTDKSTNVDLLTIFKENNIILKDYQIIFDDNIIKNNHNMEKLLQLFDNEYFKLYDIEEIVKLLLQTINRDMTYNKSYFIIIIEHIVNKDYGYYYKTNKIMEIYNKLYKLEIFNFYRDFYYHIIKNGMHIETIISFLYDNLKYADYLYIHRLFAYISSYNSCYCGNNNDINYGFNKFNNVSYSELFKTIFLMPKNRFNSDVLDSLLLYSVYKDKFFIQNEIVNNEYLIFAIIATKDIGFHIEYLNNFIKKTIENINDKFIIIIDDKENTIAYYKQLMLQFYKNIVNKVIKDDNFDFETIKNLLTSILE